MRIAIPADENKKDLCLVFARSPYFMVYDTQTDEKRFIGNPAVTSNGGAGAKAAQFLVDEKVDVLITPRCGENAAEVLKMAEVKIYKSQETEVWSNVEDYLEGKLEELTKFHSGFHGTT